MKQSTLFTPWPKAMVERYRAQGFWRGEVLHTILSLQARKFGHRTALIQGDQRRSYHSLINSVEALASGLLSIGLKPQDRVVLHMPNSIEFYETLFALMRIGVIPVLALASHKKTEITYFCKHADAKAYITHFEAHHTTTQLIAEQLQAYHNVPIVISSGTLGNSIALDALKHHDPSPRMLPKCKGSDIALLQLSGGTTGTPKLIPRTHDDYYYSVRSSAELCQFSKETVYLVVMPAPHNFILSSPGALGVFYRAGTVVLAPDPSPDTVFSLIKKHKVTCSAIVPPLALSWINSIENAKNRGVIHTFPSLKLLQVGGAKLSTSVAKKIKPTFGCQLQQVFGMAEGLVNYTRLEDQDDYVCHTQGRPLSPADEIRIVDDQDQPVPNRTEGHLLTRGPYTIRGYFRAESHNKKAFTYDGFYRTGDIVKRTNSGHIVVTGRSKDQINRGGEKIAAEEIENLCLQHHYVHDVAVVAIPDEYLGECSCAFIVPKTEHQHKTNTSIATSLLAYLRASEIASFKVPDRVEIIKILPKTNFGKIDKATLRKNFIQHSSHPTTNEKIEGMAP